MKTTLADNKSIKGGLLVVFGTIFSVLIAVGVVVTSIVLPLRTGSSLEEVVQNSMMPSVRSGFEESNQSINQELAALRETLVARATESFNNEFKAKGVSLAKSIIPLLENYFFDNAKENIQKEIDGDPRITGIRYRLREKDQPETLGNASGDLLEFTTAKDPAFRGVQITLLVPRSFLTEVENTEKQSVDTIQAELSTASQSLEQRILEETATMQSSILSNLTRDIWILMIIAGVMIVGSGVLLIQRSIILPLRKTKAHLEAIAEGDLSADLDYSSNNELGDMARAMNNMVANLRRIVSDIHASVATVANHSQGLTSTTRQLAEGARTQAGMADQAAAAITEMAQSFIEVSRNATDASNTARESNQLAQSGRAMVVDTSSGMSAIANKTSESSRLIEELGRSGEKISGIVNVIDEIADQTNLLALNAAIEAARAGEHGRGFAVVADEVRHLAARTGEATKEITQMIDKIQQDTARSVDSMGSVNAQVEKGVAQAEEAKHAMEGIVSSSDSSQQLVERIAAAVEQQSAAAEEVSASVETIAGVSKTTEDLGDSLQLASRELSNLSAELEKTIAWFRVGHG